jgi:polyisoprenoid-binding protein YceI
LAEEKIMNLRLAVLALLAVLGASVQAVEYNAIAADKSRLSFVYRQMGVPLDGEFRKFAAQIAFDPTKPAAARASIDVDLAGVDAGSAEANDELAGKAWFNSKAFPVARFVASGVKPLGGNRYAATGQMSLKGRSQTVNVEFTLTPQGSTGALDGRFILRRADFSVGEGVWADFGTVANEIEVRFHLLATAGK